MTHPRLAMALLICLVLVTFPGCGGEEIDPRGQRMSVRGTVSLDGKPLDRARIVFNAAEGQNKITATGTIVDGVYEIPAEHGPLAGKMRVEIQPEKIEMEEFEAARDGHITRRVPVNAVIIPPRYNTRSTLTAVVTENESENVFDFELESKLQ